MADKSIRQTSGQIDAMADSWPMIDALMGGTAAMRKAGKKFLPQWPNEDDESYKTRLATAVLHNVFKRTVIVNAARPFSRSIQIGDKTPPKVVEYLDDIDLQGSNLPAFASQLMAGCLSHGIVGVLVEYPKAAEVRTKADEKAAGVRPYCVRYPATAILGWKTRKGANGMELSQLRLLESVEEEDGEYGTKSVEQVRVLSPGAWATYRKDATGDTWSEADSGVTTLNCIPFVFFYGMRQAFGIGVSPLIDLAFQNVEHWQNSSDQQTILHVARVPILFAKGFGDTDITIGAAAAASSDNADADLTFVEHTGAAIAAGRTSIIDLEDRMRAAGAELLSQRPENVTATQVLSEGEAAKSTLQQIVEVFEESLEACLNFMAAWVSEQPTAEVELYKDFDAVTDTDPQVLASANTVGALSKQTMFEELQRRDVIAADRTWDDEKVRLAAEKPAKQEPAPQET